MQTSPSLRPKTWNIKQRSLKRLNKFHFRFLTKGRGNRKFAMKYENVINRALLDIPLKKTVPCILHCDLGITVKHLRLFQKDCHKIDLQLAREKAASNRALTDSPFDVSSEQK